MPKVDIGGMHGEVCFATPEGKIVQATAAMDEIAVSISMGGIQPVVLIFEDTRDIAIFRIDLNDSQAENLAKALLDMVKMKRCGSVPVGPTLEASLLVIEDLLKNGEHEGPCDNDEDPYDSCSLHVKAGKERGERAREFLKTAGREA